MGGCGVGDEGDVQVRARDQANVPVPRGGRRPRRRDDLHQAERARPPAEPNRGHDKDAGLRKGPSGQHPLKGMALPGGRRQPPPRSCRRRRPTRSPSGPTGTGPP